MLTTNLAMRATFLAATAVIVIGAPPPATAQSAPVICDGRKATIVGTDKSDKLEGTPKRDVIHGLKGRDTISGLGARDVICGGRGGDTISGGSGPDRIFGNEGGYVGDDEGTGRWYGNKLDGGRGDDFLSGGPDHDIDWPDYGSTPDRASFDDATGPITVHANGTVTGEGMGTDTLAEDLELIVGSDFADTMTTVGVRSDLRGRGGEDRLHARPGSSVTLSGGDGDDRLAGRNADGLDLSGGDGNDTLRGSSRSDHVAPGAGDDSVKTYDGPDLVHGGARVEAAGVDSLVTGAGNDTIGVGERSAGSTVDAGPGSDKLNVAWEHGDAHVDAPAGTATVGGEVVEFESTDRYEFFGPWSAESHLTFLGTNADERIRADELGELAGLEIRTLGGDDSIDLAYAWTPSNLVYAGAGDDVMHGSRRADDLFGGNGADFANGHRGDDYCAAEEVKNCER